MAQLSFPIESSLLSLSSIVIGTALGLIVVYNVILDSGRTPSWSSLAFAPPRLLLGVMFTVVHLIALATTDAPALRASRACPAEAPRYR